MSLRAQNASGWFTKSIHSTTYFSPNAAVLACVAKQPDKPFWLTTYTEFACVMVNRLEQTIYAVRDHVGLEPLFYYVHQNQFMFGSNLPDLIRALKFTPPLNENYVKQILLSACGGRSEYTDETLYQGIYRLEPGCLLSIRNDQIKTSSYWRLDKIQAPIIYQDARDYLEHFSELFAEGIQAQIKGYDKVAVEFSGGLDSSAVVCGLHDLQINPGLFMHVAPPDGGEVDDSRYAFDLTRHLHLDKPHSIDAQDFDVLRVVDQCSRLFAGTPSYLFPIGANNVHQAISKAGYRLVLSGFGGDECASMHAPMMIYYRELYFRREFAKLWSALDQSHKLRQGLGLMYQASVPYGLRDVTRRAFNRPVPRRSPLFNSMRQYEHALIQGKYSYHVRLRLEEAAIMGKSLGFSVQYPLLYPKLLEFCHALPLNLKRAEGNNRLMVRHYLAQFLPPHLYQKHQKKGGIMPATMHKMQEEYQQGCYDDAFSDLPYDKLASQLRHQYKHVATTELLQHIFLLSLKQCGELARV